MITIGKALFSTQSKVLKQFLDLTKFKLSVLNGIVTIGAYSLYPTVFTCLPLFASSVALSMSSQALNQYIEIELDRKMVRTSQRPLVLGVNPKYALALGAGFGSAGLLGLLSYNNLTAGIGVTIWLSYLFVYTRMKRQSELNTLVGSVIGSLPVYLGWAASGRSICMVQPFAMFIYMMAWQHQHFYGIRWIYFDDYNNAGFRMQMDKKIASAQVLAHTVLSIVLVNYSLHYFGVTSCFALGIPLTLGIYHWGIKSAIAFSKNEITPKQFKKQSYKHFTLVFMVFVACGIIGRYNVENDENIKKDGVTIQFKGRNRVKTNWEDIYNVYL